MANADDVHQVDAVVVLGERLGDDGAASTVLLERVECARKVVGGVLERQDEAVVVMSGGDPAGVGVSEAVVMRGVFGEVHGARVVCEDESKHTLGNAQHTLKTLLAGRDGVGGLTVALVTSEFHMQRARVIFQSVFRPEDGHKVLPFEAKTVDPKVHEAREQQERLYRAHVVGYLKRHGIEAVVHE